jgi:hypothetical protein
LRTKLALNPTAFTIMDAGYNFTDLSDGLTDLWYRSRGPFVNIVSTL